VVVVESVGNIWVKCFVYVVGVKGVVNSIGVVRAVSAVCVVCDRLVVRTGESFVVVQVKVSVCLVWNVRLRGGAGPIDTVRRSCVVEILGKEDSVGNIGLVSFVSIEDVVDVVSLVGVVRLVSVVCVVIEVDVVLDIRIVDAMAVVDPVG
jgi:hypothetical protein